MNTITVTERSSSEEIKDAIKKLQSELDVRENLFTGIDVNIIREVLNRFVRDYWKDSNVVPGIDDWIKMNFKINKPN